jgi:hypothetical protein
MNSRELFKLAIKIIGCLALLQGLENGIEAILVLQGLAAAQQSTPNYWAAWALIKIAAGLYLMMGAAPLVNMAVPLQADTTSAVSETSPNPSKSISIAAEEQPLDRRAIFDLIVRTIGLVVLLRGLQFLCDTILSAMRTSGSEASPHGVWTVYSVVEVAVGLAMLRGVVPLVEFAFPRQAANGQSKTELEAPQTDTDTTQNPQGPPRSSQ